MGKDDIARFIRHIMPFSIGTQRTERDLWRNILVTKLEMFVDAMRFKNEGLENMDIKMDPPDPEYMMAYYRACGREMQAVKYRVALHQLNGDGVPGDPEIMQKDIRYLDACIGIAIEQAPRIHDGRPKAPPFLNPMQKVLGMCPEVPPSSVQARVPKWVFEFMATHPSRVPDAF